MTQEKTHSSPAMDKPAPPTRSAEIDNLKVISLFTAHDLSDIVRGSLVRHSADHFFFADPEHNLFERNPANTMAYSALRAMEDRALVHFAETLNEWGLRDLTSTAGIVALRNHRDAVSHPLTIKWRRPAMTQFIDEKRHWRDLRPAIAWNIHCSINSRLRSVGEEARLETVDATPEMAAVLATILRFSIRPDVQFLPEEDLLDFLRRFLPRFLEYLVEHPDGR